MSNPNTTMPQSAFAGFHTPNYTQVPDELFDELLVELSGAELKVLLYIIRRTFGFKKTQDSISISQMLHGITTKDGKVLDKGVGLSKPTLLQALRSLQEKNIIETERRRSQEKGDEPTIYKLKFAENPGKESLPGGGQKTLPGGGKESSPGPWSKNFTTQETVEQHDSVTNSNIRMAQPEKEKVDSTSSSPEEQTFSAQVSRETPQPVKKHDFIPNIPPTRSSTPSDIAYSHPSNSAPPTTSSSQGFEGVGQILARQTPQTPLASTARRAKAKRQSPAPAPSSAYSDDRQVILAYIEDMAREFNDQAPLKSSTSRAEHLYLQSGLPRDVFINRLYEARAITKESSAQVRKMVKNPTSAYPAKNKMAYFFSVLEDRLGLKDEQQE